MYPCLSTPQHLCEASDQSSDCSFVTSQLGNSMPLLPALAHFLHLQNGTMPPAPRAALRVLGGACAASSSAPFPFFFLLPQLSGEAGDSRGKRWEEQVHTLSASLTSTGPRHLLHWKVKKGVTGCSLQPMDIQSATEIALCFY